MAEYEVRIDRKKCIGAGFCEKLTPKIFKVDGNNRVTLIGAAAKGDIQSVAVGEVDLKASMEAAKVCPSYAIEVLRAKSGKSVLGIEPGKEIEVKKIVANYESRKEWQMDPKGFFTIKPFPDEGVIRVRYYNAKHQLAAEIEGKTAEEIYNTVCREKLVSSLPHSAYLGSELQKAELAMKKRLPYVQDEPLKL